MSDGNSNSNSNSKTPVNPLPQDDNILRAEKRRKLGDLRSQGVDPYPHTFERSHSTAPLKTEFTALEPGQRSEEGKLFSIGGRLMAHRQMGKASFINVQDQSGSIQVYIKHEDLKDQSRQSFDLMDIGDIVGVTGHMFRTKTGEVSLYAHAFKMLCKTLEPLPEKFHGLSDVETKYRHRHLDLIMDQDSRKVFETRSKIIREIRKFLDDRGFLEVETPILQPIYGGAAARPFVTHHNALDMRLYMKISPELYLKRLIVGGFEKVYDLNKNFRNEGIDRSHNPEFSMVEWYEAYTDYLYQMKQFEELVAHVALTVTGSYKVEYQGKELDFTAPWRRLTMYEAIQEYGKLDVEKMTAEQVFRECEKHGTRHFWSTDPSKHPKKGELVAELFEHVCEKHLIQPTFILDHPVEISPLTKKHRSKPGLVERFEPFAAGMELGNSYSELNDPEDQRARLEEQDAKRVVDEEAQPMDLDFLHAIDVGMPPTGGVGLGVERLVMLLTNQASIRDIILFPTMKFKS